MNKADFCLGQANRAYDEPVRSDETFTRRLLDRLSFLRDQLGGSLDLLLELQARNHGASPTCGGAGGCEATKPIGRFAEVEDLLGACEALAGALRARSAELNASH